MCDWYINSPEYSECDEEDRDEVNETLWYIKDQLLILGILPA